MYDKEGCSGKIIYKVAEDMELINPIKKLCEVTWKEGLEKGLHNPSQWTYAGMLDYLGREIVGKNSGRAGPLMYKNAEINGLIEEIKKLKDDAWKIGLEAGCHEENNWTLNGMLKFLGIKIALVEGRKIPSY